ncbi:DUF1415 domain-containing protein [Brumicola nitratireducens]|uniref:Uncharacterized protein n=1 Tax=Glaciecola nitratireducens (strain JCM 12485 / KCTC 12276 / FR1064) TaxID=1085623 RepID=G4QK58_GLANF|nr:DUF1415 domain-containing protein [Glaciecola nitratireducens]AEP29180.1 hypothetical protein GNIT_1043 [Glaciecola nitratireducens FR1064]
MTTQTAVEQTLHWVDKVIIGENFCPFARKERDSHRIRAVATEETDNGLILQALLDEMQLLENQSNIETTLLIITNGVKDFFDYLDLVDLANRLLKQEQYEGVFQLATFHPDYMFADAPADATSHYTNRSPFPMLHIIREESLELALETFPNPENIPVRNIKHAEKLGKAFFQQLLGSHDQTK